MIDKWGNEHHLAYIKITPDEVVYQWHDTFCNNSLSLSVLIDDLNVLRLFYIPMYYPCECSFGPDFILIIPSKGKLLDYDTYDSLN